MYCVSDIPLRNAFPSLLLPMGDKLIDFAPDHVLYFLTVNPTIMSAASRDYSTPGVEIIDHLDADKIHADLVQRSLQDERLYPLLPLLGVDPSQIPATTSSKGTNVGQAQAEPQATEYGSFKLPDSLVKEFSLEDWEVQQVVDGKSFKNWVALVDYKPAYILIVRSMRGIQAVIRWAGLINKKVRVAGYRHTWSPLYSTPDDIIITFIPPILREELPYDDPPADWHSELQGITLLDTLNGNAPKEGHAFARIMAGTTNNQFRLWCHEHGQLALPFNTVVLAVTFGGTNATICHGAGLSTSTLSDLVLEIEYVDARGQLQKVFDPEELKAASGCFGLLGVVTSITLQLEPMTISEMRPTQVPLVLAIPPPRGFPIPQIVLQQMSEANITSEDVEKARLEWIRRCEEDHFHEWFWFPYQKNAWVNTWRRRSRTPEDSSLPQFPKFGLENYNDAQVHSAFAASIAGWKWLPPALQTYSFGLASLASLPNIRDGQPSMTSYISEGLHFRGGSQNFPFWGMEWELPISHVDGKRDYEAIQRAWWDGISAIYSRPECPVRAALEMRLTGGSSVLLAPQRSNQSTASIEIFTHLTTPPEEWRGIRQLVVDRWTSYTDREGKRQNARPHWAKHWFDLNVDGKPIETYIKEDAYLDAFKEFRETFSKITERRGSTVEESRTRFDNELMGRLVFD